MNIDGVYSIILVALVSYMKKYAEIDADNADCTGIDGEAGFDGDDDNVVEGIITEGSGNNGTNTNSNSNMNMNTNVNVNMNVILFPWNDANEQLISTIPQVFPISTVLFRCMYIKFV